YELAQHRTPEGFGQRLDLMEAQVQEGAVGPERTVLRCGTTWRSSCSSQSDQTASRLAWQEGQRMQALQAEGDRERRPAVVATPAREAALENAAVRELLDGAPGGTPKPAES